MRICLQIIAFLLFAPFGVSANDCGHYYARLPGIVIQTLRREGFASSEVEVLSENGVFLLRLPNGNKAVLRLEGSMADPKFEVFASKLFNQISSAPTPWVRNLDPELVGPFLKKFETEFPAEFAAFKKSATGNGLVLNELNASLAPFVDGASKGFHYLENLKIPESLQVLLRDIHPDDLDYQRKYFLRRWNSMPQAARAKGEKILSDIYGLPPQNAFAQFVESGMNLPSETKYKIISEILLEIPDSLKTELSDTWAIDTVLGINDFHRGNWLLKDKVLLPIDKAYKTGQRLDASGSFKGISLEDAQEPFGFGEISDEVYLYLLRHVSAKTAERLKGLSASELQALAKEAGYEAPKQYLSQVVARRDKMMELIGAVSEPGFTLEK